jgi:GNAT superfamily N-acetyltransferase
MKENLIVRRASKHDAEWIVDLSQRVQEALTASGSLQQIGPLPRATVEASILAETAYLLEASSHRLGSVLVDPVIPTYRHHLIQWRLDTFPGPLWFLHALMLEPEEQGKGLGKVFLDGVKDLVIPHNNGTIVLDCWAGNEKLRDFYLRAGFTFHGEFPVKDFEVAVFVSTCSPNGQS